MRFFFLPREQKKRDRILRKKRMLSSTFYPGSSSLCLSYSPISTSFMPVIDFTATLQCESCKKSLMAFTTLCSKPHGFLCEKCVEKSPKCPVCAWPLENQNKCPKCSCVVVFCETCKKPIVKGVITCRDGSTSGLCQACSETAHVEQSETKKET